MASRLVFLMIVLGALLWAANDAHARPVCAMTVTNINFGNVDVLSGAAVDITGSINFNCTGFHKNDVNQFCISIGSGANFSGSQRQLNGPGGTTLNYDLYKNSARTQLWGSWQTGFQTAGLQIDFPSDNRGNVLASVPIYARLFGNQQTAAPGAYSTTFPASPVGVYARFDKRAGTPPCDAGMDNAQAGFLVLATVIPACSVSATDLNFGTVGLVTGNVDATSSLTVSCAPALSYTVSLSGGNAAASDPTQRKMAKGAEEITYGLYSDAGRAQPWGNTIGTDTVAATGTGVAQSITVYGRVPAQATGSPGTYSDTIVVSVTY